MPWARARLLALGGLVCGCSSLHPTFEQRIGSGTGWNLFLASRYGCDTVMTDAARALTRPVPPPSRPAMPAPTRGNRTGGAAPGVESRPSEQPPEASRYLGMTPCQLAGEAPTEIRGFKIEDGIREEWLRAGVLMYRFEGPHPTGLRVVRVGIP